MRGSGPPARCAPADIECVARDPEVRGRARATLTRRLYTIARFYRNAVGEDHSPAAHVRRSRTDYQSHATGLDRSEPGELPAATALGTAAEHAPVSLLALNEVPVSGVTRSRHRGIQR